MTKLYVAGPMRGRPQFNFPAFHDAAADLRRAGYEIFSPAERDEEVHGLTFAMGNATGDHDEAVTRYDFDIRAALGDDVAYIAHHADGIAVLPGWEASLGAIAETALANALGLPVRTVDEWLTLWATTPTLRGGVSC